MNKANPEILVSQYEAWKATRRFLVGESKPRTPWAKPRAKALQLEKLAKRFAQSRATRLFVIKP